jgi:integrase
MSTWRKDPDGYLMVDFSLPYQGRRYRIRQSLRLRDTPENRRRAKELTQRIQGEIALGHFTILAELFPASKLLKRLGFIREQSALPTLDQFSCQWLTEKEARRSKGTVAYYQYILETHVRPDLIAQLPIDRIKEQDAEEFIARLIVKGASGGLVNRVRARMVSIFRVAQRRLKIDNPFTNVERISEDRDHKRELDPFTPVEVATIIQTAEGREHDLVIVAFGTGMRPGELFGLRWTEVDFGVNQLRVIRSVGQYGEGKPKTKKSRRAIDMTPTVRAALEGQRERSELLRRAVFPNARGGYFHEHNWNERNWTTLLKKAGVRFRPFGQCRHTFATLMLSDQKTDLRYVADQMGHRNLEMLLKHYWTWTQGRVPKPKHDMLAGVVDMQKPQQPKIA